MHDINVQEEPCAKPLLVSPSLLCDFTKNKNEDEYHKVASNYLSINPHDSTVLFCHFGIHFD